MSDDSVYHLAMDVLLLVNHLVPCLMLVYFIANGSNITRFLVLSDVKCVHPSPAKVLILCSTSLFGVSALQSVQAKVLILLRQVLLTTDPFTSSLSRVLHPMR